MKLKKFAALALAGVMAVSMLAGCANKPGSSEPTTEEPTSGVNAAAVVAAVEEKVAELEKAAGKDYITVTTNATLQADLEKTVAMDLLNVDASHIWNNLLDVDATLTGTTLTSLQKKLDAKTAGTKESSVGIQVVPNDGVHTDAFYVSQLAQKMMDDQRYGIRSSLETALKDYNAADAYNGNPDNVWQDTIAGQASSDYTYDYTFELQVAVVEVTNPLTDAVNYVVACNVVRTPVKVDA